MNEQQRKRLLLPRVNEVLEREMKFETLLDTIEALVEKLEGLQVKASKKAEYFDLDDEW